MKEIRVVELFAGVGGFRLGLNKASDEAVKFKTIWANQFEPSTKRQHAAEVYVARFGNDGFDNRDIEEVLANDFGSIPNHDLLVGGFPCQDYSVASTLKNSQGLIGKKGVLFWSIYSILKRQGDHAPSYIFLENVDRLLKSPAKQRGKDFAVMLAALSDLGYALEWRVVNAADYGFPQRRRRVFLVGYRQGTNLNEESTSCSPVEWITQKGVLSQSFPGQAKSNLSEFDIEGDYAEISSQFSKHNPARSPFLNSGFMTNRRVSTQDLIPIYDGPQITLGDLLVDEAEVPEAFFIPEEDVRSWQKHKEAKKEERVAASGHVYLYSEGAMSFPDPLDRPSRTIITGEGGSGASRFKHVVQTPSGRLRRLVPVELERLNQFPDGHTELTGIPDGRRAFFMGNALVVGAVTRVGESLASRL